ncbi:hypothetical protein PM082_017884 [Marasmius tenuissimus]|nr:hypothetical protein PM082_017884 [Marasmius tenuissimus]
MPLPPDTASNSIFSCLDPPDIISYSRTCREAYLQVQMYWTRALCIYRLLSRFFSEDEARQFRAVQALTGTLISGSMALQFFNRTLYPGSDLDIYVEHRYCEPVAVFLRSIGYKYEPNSTQNSSLWKAIMKATDNLRRGVDVTYDEEMQDVSERGFAGVFNMMRGEQKIQLITAKNSPMDIVLNFHSTVVMNVISYSHAYSLYPEATFEKSLSLICYQCDGMKRTVPIQKYIGRGWTMIDYDAIEYVPSDDALESAGALAVNHNIIFRKRQMRHLGDSYCWTYRLPALPVTFHPGPGCSSASSVAWLSREYESLTPLAREEIQTGLRALEGNSWVLGHGNDGFGHMNFSLLSNSQLRFMYCVVSGWEPEGDPRAPRSWWGQRGTAFQSDDLEAESDDLLLRALVKQRALRETQRGEYIEVDKRLVG